MRYQLVYQGTASDLKIKLPDLEDKHIPEGGLAELRLNFRHRFPGFENAAVLLNDNLLNKTGVAPWPDTWQIVYVDPTQPVWYVRWQKGAAWAPYIVAALVAIAIVLVVLATWQLFKVAPEVIRRYPWLVPVTIVGGMILAFAYFTRKRSPP